MCENNKYDEKKQKRHEYYLKNKKRIKEKTKKWKQKNKEHTKKYMSEYQKKYLEKNKKNCVDCSKLIQKHSTRCVKCNYKQNKILFGGKNNPNYGNTREKSIHWKGGKRKTKQGYIVINVGQGKQRSIYQFEHRLVMEKHLKRKLERWEYIHHVNGNKTDNRIQNLKIVMAKKHFSEIRCPHCMNIFLIR